MIFITGCTGLVGSTLARQLIQQGAEVVAPKRANSDFSLVKDIKDRIEWVDTDLFDFTTLDSILKKCDTVIHAAAVISFSPKNREKMYKVNVEGTANLVNIALQNNIKSFCHVSSIAALGRKKDAQVVSEESLWEESEYNSHYAQSKYLAELEVFRGIEEGLSAFIVNPSVILGAGNWENGSTKIFKYIFNGNRFYTPGHISYVDVLDISEAVIRLLELNPRGEKFILNAGRMTYQEFFKLIAQNFNTPTPVFEVKNWMAQLAWRFEYLKNIFSDKEPLISKETANLSSFSYEYPNQKILKYLKDFQFRKPESSVERICKELTAKYVHK